MCCNIHIPNLSTRISCLLYMDTSVEYVYIYTEKYYQAKHQSRPGFRLKRDVAWNSNTDKVIKGFQHRDRCHYKSLKSQFYMPFLNGSTHLSCILFRETFPLLGHLPPSPLLSVCRVLKAHVNLCSSTAVVLDRFDLTDLVKNGFRKVTSICRRH